ncbi:MAG: hypothetical protein LBI69_00685 [Puniceicoccales bacterium]|jgi:hypothetical protein|nr:hypothetical protein [Puniceicoccales bacterium]
MNIEGRHSNRPEEDSQMRELSPKSTHCNAILWLGAQTVPMKIFISIGIAFAVGALLSGAAALFLSLAFGAINPLATVALGLISALAVGLTLLICTREKSTENNDSLHADDLDLSETVTPLLTNQNEPITSSSMNDLNQSKVIAPLPVGDLDQSGAVTFQEVEEPVSESERPMKDLLTFMNDLKSTLLDSQLIEVNYADRTAKLQELFKKLHSFSLEISSDNRVAEQPMFSSNLDTTMLKVTPLNCKFIGEALIPAQFAFISLAHCLRSDETTSDQITQEATSAYAAANTLLATCQELSEEQNTDWNLGDQLTAFNVNANWDDFEQAQKIISNDKVVKLIYCLNSLARLPIGKWAEMFQFPIDNCTKLLEVSNENLEMVRSCFPKMKDAVMALINRTDDSISEDAILEAHATIMKFMRALQPAKSGSTLRKKRISQGETAWQNERHSAYRELTFVAAYRVIHGKPLNELKDLKLIFPLLNSLGVDYARVFYINLERVKSKINTLPISGDTKSFFHSALAHVIISIVKKQLQPSEGTDSMVDRAQFLVEFTESFIGAFEHYIDECCNENDANTSEGSRRAFISQFQEKLVGNISKRLLHECDESIQLKVKEDAIELLMNHINDLILENLPEDLKSALLNNTQGANDEDFTLLQKMSDEEIATANSLIDLFLAKIFPRLPLDIDETLKKQVTSKLKAKYKKIKYDDRSVNNVLSIIALNIRVGINGKMKNNLIDRIRTALKIKMKGAESQMKINYGVAGLLSEKIIECITAKIESFEKNNKNEAKHEKLNIITRSLPDIINIIAPTMQAEENWIKYDSDILEPARILSSSIKNELYNYIVDEIKSSVNEKGAIFTAKLMRELIQSMQQQNTLLNFINSFLQVAHENKFTERFTIIDGKTRQMSFLGIKILAGEIISSLNLAISPRLHRDIADEIKEILNAVFEKINNSQSNKCTSEELVKQIDDQLNPQKSAYEKHLIARNDNSYHIAAKLRAAEASKKSYEAKINELEGREATLISATDYNVITNELASLTEKVTHYTTQAKQLNAMLNKEKEFEAKIKAAELELANARKSYIDTLRKMSSQDKVNIQTINAYSPHAHAYNVAAQTVARLYKSHASESLN